MFAQIFSIVKKFCKMQKIDVLTSILDKSGHFYSICMNLEQFLHEQGWIHGYRSRVRVGGGSDQKGYLKHLGRSSNAERQDTKNAKKDRPTDIAG